MNCRLDERLDDITARLDYLQTLARVAINPQNLPPALGDFRLHQKASTVLLKKFTDFLDAHQIHYWLDFGTLLGAVRHGGFIPWDDDLDISVLRADYECLLKLLPEWNCNGFWAKEDHMLRVYYKKTRLVLDVFPYYSGNAVEPKTGAALETMHKKMQVFFNQIPFVDDPQLPLPAPCIPGEYWAEVARFYKEELLENQSALENGYLFYPFHTFLPLMFPLVLTAFADIFPLQRLDFEGFSFSIPKNAQKYLHSLYGDFMVLPPKHLKTHGMGQNLSVEERREIVELLEKLA